MKKSLPLFFFLSLLLTTAGWAQTIDRSFKFEVFRYGSIATTAPAPGGGVFIAGTLDKLNGIAVGDIVKIKASRDIDQAFKFDNPDPTRQLSSISDILPYPDGKLLAVGLFGDQNGYYKDIVFRTEADGSADPSFSSPFADLIVTIRAIGMQSDGKVIVSGATGDGNGTSENFVKRLNTDGSIDDTFTAPELGDNDNVEVIVVLPDDEIIIAGGFSELNGVATANDIARLNADGSFDEDFNANIEDDDNNTSIYNVWRMADGSMFVRAFGRYLQKIEADGSPDASYAPDHIITSADPTIVLPDGTTIVTLTDELKSYDVTGAELHSIDFDNDYGQLLAYGDTEIITQFIATDPNSTAVVISSDLIVEFKLFGLSRNDESVGYGSNYLKQPDGKLIVRTYGRFFSNGTDLYPVKTWFRLNADLSFDDTLTFPDNLFDNYMVPVFVDSNGRIYMVNKATESEVLLRFLPDGTLDGSFTAVEGDFNDIVELENSNFVGVAGRYHSELIKFDESGTVDPLVTYSSPYELSSILIGSDGKWYVVGGSPHFVERLNTDGTAADGFNPTSSIGRLDVNRSEIYNDQIYVAAPLYDNRDNTNIDIYPLSVWDTDGQGKLIKDPALEGQEGVNVAIDEDANRVYLLSRVFNDKKYELRAFRTDGSIDTRFSPIKYERASNVYVRDNFILLEDKSLLIISDTIYHVVLPSVPAGPDNTTVSISGNNIHIAWSDNSNNETLFEIWRSIDGGDYTLLTTTTANTTTYVDVRGADGTYTYRVYAANAGGVSEDFGEATLDIVTGLMEAEAGWKVYPNPVKGHLQIESNEVVERFTLFQMDGRAVETSSPHANQFTINMNSFATGLYLLKMEHPNGKKVVKIFKQ